MGKNNDLKICGVVALYKPTKEDITRIEPYISELDYCILMDDTGCDNSNLFTNLIAKWNGKCEYVCNSVNLGLCKSVNVGFRKAVSLGANWILVMNPDGTFENDALGIFKNYIRNNDTEKVGILCPQYNFDRHPRTASSGYTNVKWPDMTGCLYNAKILDQLQYYDENTYFYGLDTEYCLRVRKAGFAIIQCNEAVLNHHPAETRRKVFLRKFVFQYGYDVPVRYYYQFRTAYYIHNKYGLMAFRNDMFHLYKYMKVCFLFDNKNEYKKMIKLGIKDAKKGYYGKYH